MVCQQVYFTDYPAETEVVVLLGISTTLQRSRVHPLKDTHETESGNVDALGWPILVSDNLTQKRYWPKRCLIHLDDV